MVVACSRGELGWVKVGTVGLNAQSVTPTDEPALFIPPTLGGFYPINYANGLSTPSVVVRTNPYAQFWTAAQFMAWFGLGATDRSGELGTCPDVSWFDGNEYNSIGGAKADSFTVEWVQGGPVDLTMAFMGISTSIAVATTYTRSTASPAMYLNCALGTATGVHYVQLSFANRCYPSGELTTTNRPAAINAAAPVFSLNLLQKPGGVAPTTSETVAITAPGGNTLTFAMTFRQTAGPQKTIVFGETLYRRIYTGMLTTAGGNAFSVAAS